MVMSRVLLLLTVICLAAGCTCGLEGAPAVLQSGRPTATPVVNARSVVARAKDDLAVRLGIDPSAIEVVRVSTEEFPAQNLGCLSSDREPVQPALVTGKEIVLKANGRYYLYRAHGGIVLFCRESP